jgi:hypothetical protein
MICHRFIFSSQLCRFDEERKRQIIYSQLWVNATILRQQVIDKRRQTINDQRMRTSKKRKENGKANSTDGASASLLTLSSSLILWEVNKKSFFTSLWYAIKYLFFFPIWYYVLVDENKTEFVGVHNMTEHVY